MSHRGTSAQVGPGVQIGLGMGSGVQFQLLPLGLLNTLGIISPCRDSEFYPIE